MQMLFGFFFQRDFLLFLLASLPKYVVFISALVVVHIPVLSWNLFFLDSVHFLFHSGGLFKGSEAHSTDHSV